MWIAPTLLVLAPLALAPAQQSQTQTTAERAVALAQGGDCEAALPLLDAAIEAAPDDVVLRRWRGHCRNLLEEYIGALADYDRALVLDDTDPWTHYARAMSLHSLGRLREAVDGYGAAIERSPDYLKAVQWRAFTHMLLGEYRDALRDYDRALQIAPGDAWTIENRAQVKLRLRDFDGAAHDYSLLTAAYPDDSLYRLYHALALTLTGHRDRAWQDFGRLLEVDPDAEGYAALWRWWVDRDRERAERELTLWREGRDGWEALLADVMLGQGSIDAVEAHRLAQPEIQQPALACERDFYHGLALRSAGESERAIHALEAAIASNSRASWEWDAARIELGSLADALGRRSSLGFTLDPGGVVTTAGPVAAGVGLEVGDQVVAPAPAVLAEREADYGAGQVLTLEIRRGDRAVTVEVPVIVARG